jgi:DNA-binding NtrC family response regulator
MRETMAQRNVALIDGESYTHDLRRLLAPAGIGVFAVGSDALERVSVSNIDLFVISNHCENPARISSLLRRLRRVHPKDPVFILACVSSEQLTVAALKEGATDYFCPPIELREIAEAVRRCISAAPVQEARREEGGATNDLRQAIVGDSPFMCDLRAYVSKVAQRECTTLVLGETGTGKDLIAEAIHLNSPRHAKPFVCVNCAAIPDTLLESELFGYEKGAFTGADGPVEGKIRQAQGGTIFFDEIGDMTPYAQAKILRVIESKQIQRLGGKASVPVNIRIIAATNQDLPDLISKQRFRKDLYFRLNVAQIQLPPLRDRRDDIPSLLEHYLRMFNQSTGSHVQGFTPEAIFRLQSYDWPGNVRELRSLVESVFIDPPTSQIDECHLPWARMSPSCEPKGDHERDQLLEALHSTKWNKSKAAEKLRWSRMKIYRKLAKYHIREHAEDEEMASAGMLRF